MVGLFRIPALTSGPKTRDTESTSLRSGTLHHIPLVLGTDDANCVGEFVVCMVLFHIVASVRAYCRNERICRHVHNPCYWDQTRSSRPIRLLRTAMRCSRSLAQQRRRIRSIRGPRGIGRAMDASKSASASLESTSWMGARMLAFPRGACVQSTMVCSGSVSLHPDEEV